jgi:hypothetical protein
MDDEAQSEVDPGDPTWLSFDYMRRIADVIDVLAERGAPLRVVHVGGAAMALPRYVAATRPRSSQIVLEPVEAVTELVRRELPLPARAGIRVRPVDGLSGVAALRDASTDVVVLDAFAGGEVPRELLSVGFFADVARVLATGGVLVANVADRAPFPDGRAAVAGLRQVFAQLVVGAEPATLKGRRRGNLVLVAGASVAEAAIARAWTGGGSPYRRFAGTAVADSFGGGAPIYLAEPPSP